MPRVSRQELDQFTVQSLEQLGVPSSAASSVSESLVEADLRGHHSHGALRIPIYAQMIDDGAIRPEAEPTREQTGETTIHLDGHSAFGQVVGRNAIEAALPIANSKGTAVVGIRNAAHLGRIGEWAERAATEGLLFAAFVNHQGGGKTVAPAGSAERRLGTNPMAFGIPTFGAVSFPIVHDMATSQVAHGKIRERAHGGEPVPESWTTYDDGDPVTDPEAFEDGEGALLPLGGRESGYKGFGLSLVSEFFASIVGDALTAAEADPKWTSNAGCFVCIDPQQFTTPERIEQQVESFVEYLENTEFSDAVPLGAGARSDKLNLPGEIEHRTRAEYLEDGIPLPHGVISSLRAFDTDVDAHLDL
jgi:uncharacterized oxidoreductase